MRFGFVRMNSGLITPPIYFDTFLPPAGQRCDSIATSLTCWWAQPLESVKVMGFGAANNLPA